MATSLEERLADVEREIAALKRLLGQTQVTGWERTFGMFADDPEFDEILRQGDEIRRRDRADSSE